MIAAMPLLRLAAGNIPYFSRDMPGDDLENLFVNVLIPMFGGTGDMAPEELGFEDLLGNHELSPEMQRGIAKVFMDAGINVLTTAFPYPKEEDYGYLPDDEYYVSFDCDDGEVFTRVLDQIIEGLQGEGGVLLKTVIGGLLDLLSDGGAYGKVSDFLRTAFTLIDSEVGMKLTKSLDTLDKIFIYESQIEFLEVKELLSSFGEPFDDGDMAKFGDFLHGFVEIMVEGEGDDSYGPQLFEGLLALGEKLRDGEVDELFGEIAPFIGTKEFPAGLEEVLIPVRDLVVELIDGDSELSQSLAVFVQQTVGLYETYREDFERMAANDPGGDESLGSYILEILGFFEGVGGGALTSLLQTQGAAILFGDLGSLVGTMIVGILKGDLGVTLGNALVLLSENQLDPLYGGALYDLIKRHANSLRDPNAPEFGKAS